MSRSKLPIRPSLPAREARAAPLSPAVSQLLSSAQPRYASVAATLAGEILDKGRPVGSLLPTEQELAEHFAVSRSTIRQALRRLRELGLVAGAQGVGTRVIADQPRSDYVLAVRSVTDVMGYATPTRLELLSRETVTADAAHAARIGAEAGSRWVQLRGLRWPEDRTRPPISVVDLHVAAEFAEVTTLPELVTTPAYRLIGQRMGVAVAEVLQEITAVSLPAAVAELLAVPAGSPGLHIRRRFLAADGRLLEATENHHAAADRFAYALRLGAPEGEG